MPPISSLIAYLGLVSETYAATPGSTPGPGGAGDSYTEGTGSSPGSPYASDSAERFRDTTAELRPELRLGSFTGLVDYRGLGEGWFELTWALDATTALRLVVQPNPNGSYAVNWRNSTVLVVAGETLRSAVLSASAGRVVLVVQNSQYRFEGVRRLDDLPMVDLVLDESPSPRERGYTQPLHVRSIPTAVTTLDAEGLQTFRDHNIETLPAFQAQVEAAAEADLVALLQQSGLTGNRVQEAAERMVAIDENATRFWRAWILTFAGQPTADYWLVGEGLQVFENNGGVNGVFGEGELAFSTLAAIRPDLLVQQVSLLA